MTAPPALATDATNAEMIRWAFDVINTHDVSPLRAYQTPSTVERFPDEECHGPDAIKAYFDRLFRAVPDLHMEPIKLVEDGDTVFVRWHLTGTHTGPGFAGLEPTGKRIELDGIDHFTLSDGKVVSNFVVFDQMDVGRALGMLPPDGSPADRAMKAAFNAKTKLAELIKQARS
jgi:predicted ester cyclase